MRSHVCRTPMVIWHRPEGSRFDCVECGSQWALSGRLWIRLPRKSYELTCGVCRGAGEVYTGLAWVRCTECSGSGVAA
jgi:DnaJ-class molecular chaperone